MSGYLDENDWLERVLLSTQILIWFIGQTNHFQITAGNEFTYVFEPFENTANNKRTSTSHGGGVVANPPPPHPHGPGRNFHAMYTSDC